MRLLTLLVVSLVVFHSAARGQDRGAGKEKQDLEKMQGKWYTTEEEFKGVSTPADEIRAMKKTLTVKDASFVIERVFKSGKAGKLFVGTVKLDPRSSPKQFDWAGKTPDGKSIGMLGLYELDDEKLRVVYTLFGADAKASRPTQFASDGEGGGTLVITFRRKPPE